MSRNLASKATIARLHNVSVRSVTNWHIHGYITAYRLPRDKRLLFDVHEVAEAVRTNPGIRTPDKVQGSVVLLNESVRVMPEVVTR